MLEIGGLEGVRRAVEPLKRLVRKEPPYKPEIAISIADMMNMVFARLEMGVESMLNFKGDISRIIYNNKHHSTGIPPAMKRYMRDGGVFTFDTPLDSTRQLSYWVQPDGTPSFRVTIPGKILEVRTSLGKSGYPDFENCALRVVKNDKSDVPTETLFMSSSTTTTDQIDEVLTPFLPSSLLEKFPDQVKKQRWSLIDAIKNLARKPKIPLQQPQTA